MPHLIEQPSIITPLGRKPKLIEEYVGKISTQNDAVSIARIVCPPGWSEVGQRPDFSETKIMLKGQLRVEYEDGVLDVHAGQAVVCEPGEWVRYSASESDGAEYVTICVPAFSPATVHRDAE
ncbi:MAG: cupin [Nitrospirales bacterium]|nr:cupin [Nitrospirales bacterium]